MSTKELTHKDICPYYEENCIDIGCVCPKYQAYEKVNEPGVVDQTLKELGVDPAGNRLEVMMQMQKLFAAKFHKVDDFTKDEVDYWEKAYDTCVTDEITEVHEHLSVFEDIYGKKETNKLELQKEFIDIWHFLMDEFIVGNMDAKKLIEVYAKNHVPSNVEIPSDVDPLDFFFQNETMAILDSKTMDLLEDEIDSISVLIATGHLLAGGRKIRQQISWKHWKKPAKEINYDKLHEAFAFTFSALVKCFILSGLKSRSLYEIYVKKNLENHYRQHFGY